jgi:hypothetical protein
MRLLRVPVLAHKGIGVLLLIEVTKCVVDLAMLALVRTNCCLLVEHSRYIGMMLTVEKKIAHGSVTLRHLPVVDGDLWSLHLLPLRQKACVKVFDLASVCDDGFLLKIPYQSMNSARADEISEEHEVAPDTCQYISKGQSYLLHLHVPWAARTKKRIMGPGLCILRNTSRCMRSL